MAAAAAYFSGPRKQPGSWLFGQPSLRQPGVVALALAAAQVVGAEPLLAKRRNRVRRQPRPELGQRGARGFRLTQVGCCRGDPRMGHCVLWPLDRKSTRLNSSHSQISYAV